ncbi:hypothetical protein [Streptomyces sp. NPDC048644]|uniref:hypothetical protein n=1 Tax=Streptomyces sp. NPDC048644 TaxID=3365582 RepID=UPI00371F3658
MSTRPHGYARYRLDGCRCYTCGYARSQYDDNRNRALAYGTWHPWADAEPVRVHVRHLQDCGMGLRTIASAAGTDRKRLKVLLVGRPERGTGPQERVRPGLAAAVLAVEPTLETLAAKTTISAVGTARRLQALVAGGWPQDALATGLRMTPGAVGRVVAADAVTVQTARAVRDLYDAWWRAAPDEHGASPGGITRARRRATAAGWAPVGAWDDETIDDPTAFPDWTGRCGTPEGYRAHHRVQIPLCQPCRAARAEQRAERAAA